MTPVRPERTWAALADDVERIFEALRGTAAAFEAAVAARPEHCDLADVAPLRSRIRGNLDTFRDLAVGTGLVVAPDVLRDARYWLEWWWRPYGGTPEQLRVNLDPGGPDFFDYVNDEWFDVPIRSGREHVTGPYVDYACTNQYAFTFSVPVHLGTRPLGVAAMDVPCDRLERLIMPALCADPAPRALVNPDGRVIAAGTPGVAPGDRLPGGPGVTGSGALARLCGVTGWSMLAL